MASEEEQNDEEIPLPFDIYSDLIPKSEDHRFTFLFNADQEFMLPLHYFELSPYRIFRRFALSVIESINNKCGNLDAFVPYLAMTYVDRILSSSCIPDVSKSRLKTENAPLFFTCCFIIASKMRNENFEISAILQANTFSRISTITTNEVLEMELAICERLQWRMRSITPFCFVDFFIDLLHRHSGVHAVIPHCKAHQIIIKSQGVMQLIKYKPAVVAAATVLMAGTPQYDANMEELVEIVLNTGRINGESLNEVIIHLKKVYRQLCKREAIPNKGDQNGAMSFKLDWIELAWETLDAEEFVPLDIHTFIAACCSDFTR